MTDQLLFSGSIPENYDRYLGPYLFEPYAVDIVQRIKKQDCRMMLELACGTGRVTRHIVDALCENGRLIATDINKDMLAVAKTKVGDSRVQWDVTDAQNLSFADNTFDHVICQFGVMFFPDKPRAFEEVNRVLARSGIYIFNTWGSLDQNKWTAVIHDVMDEVFKNEAPDFLQNGPYSFNDTSVIKAQLTAAGFTHIAIEPVKKVITYPNSEEFIKGFLTGTPLSMFFKNRDGSAVELVKQKLKQSLQQQFGDNCTSEMLAYVCTATKE
ncbi:MAG: methyltransferase domain-containing protein [Bacteroidota bacterium]|nr:methyltransferase domain-containing protein [Bacteroidota bacterium]